MQFPELAKLLIMHLYESLKRLLRKIFHLIPVKQLKLNTILVSLFLTSANKQGRTFFHSCTHARTHARTHAEQQPPTHPPQPRTHAQQNYVESNGKMFCLKPAHSRGNLPFPPPPFRRRLLLFLRLLFCRLSPPPALSSLSQSL